MNRTSKIVSRLIDSQEPAVRFKVFVNVLRKEPATAEIRNLQKEVKSSPLVKLLLSERDRDGKIPFHPYAKWYGAHWVLANLADIGYPPGVHSLIGAAQVKNA